MKKRVVKPGHFTAEETTKKIHVSELKIGMFISKLDKDWLETPFLVQGFLLESLDDIDIVAEHCEHVWIDAVETNWQAAEERAVADAPVRKKMSFINKVSVTDEHEKAVGVYREARRITKSLLDEARLSGVIDTQKAQSTVSDCINSILRNADALLWMSKIRDQDEYTAEHCLNVCILCVAFGRHLGMTEDELHVLGLCGLLHDVGKMRVPPEVLNKPDKLTEREFKIIKAHTVHGRNLLMSSPGVPNIAIDVAYSHHERLDASGYPRKLKASGISELARIVAIVDAFDAMTSNRCYSPSITSTDALKVLYRERGTQFDERLVSEFIKAVGLYPPGSIVELVNGLVGIVLETNHRYRHLPRIIVVKDLHGELAHEKILRLAEIEAGKLDRDHLIRRVLLDGTYDIYVRDYQEKGLAFRHQ